MIILGLIFLILLMRLSFDIANEIIKNSNFIINQDEEDFCYGKNKKINMEELIQLKNKIYMNIQKKIMIKNQIHFK